MKPNIMKEGELEPQKLKKEGEQWHDIIHR